MTDELTYMTDAHVAVIKALERRGLGLMYEVDFPPYRVDIYLSDYHAAVEVDGPTHGGMADRRRDRELLAEYGLHTFRVPADDASKPDAWAYLLREFLKAVKPTRDERWEKYGINTPWL